MRRGFKAQAERNALEARQALGLSPTAPIDPWAFANQLGVIILDFAALALDEDVANQLTVVDAGSWSAMTLKEQGTFAIVVNPAHARTRQRADLMHELAHIELKHVPSRVDVSQTGVLLLSDYSDEQEQEADWNAAALLLPRDSLVEMRARNMIAADIARYYGVSTALCDWRLRMTGVDVQINRAHRRRL